MKKYLLGIAAVAGAVAVSAPASAALTPTGNSCTLADITPNAAACTGFYQGNLLNNSNVAEQQAALLLLGFVWDGTTILQTIEGLNGSTSVDFTQLLNGTTYIGLHFGNGVGSPGRPVGGPGNNGDGDDTAFYRIDASNIDIITLAYNSSSNARLYSTGTPSVPEPSTWLMMLLGFGAVGAAAKRRRKGFGRLLQIA